MVFGNGRYNKSQRNKFAIGDYEYNIVKTEVFEYPFREANIPAFVTF